MSDPVLAFISDAAKQIRVVHDAARDLNLEAGIQWAYREKIRTVQGSMSKMDDLLNDMVWDIGTDEAVQVAKDVWDQD